MTGGFVTGGWEFVLAAYGVTFVVLGAYTATVVAALRREGRKPRPEEKR